MSWEIRDEGSLERRSFKASSNLTIKISWKDWPCFFMTDIGLFGAVSLWQTSCNEELLERASEGYLVWLQGVLIQSEA